MKITIEHSYKKYEVDLSKPLDISIPLKAGHENPNCYFAPPVEFNTIRSKSFIGSVAEGGSVNYQTVKLTPHGNGTHTECFGHLTAATEATLNNCLTKYHFIAQLVTLTPKKINNLDEVILLEDLKLQFKNNVEAIVIRTLPNEKDKLQRQYSGTNPPYLDQKAAAFLREQHVAHLLIDLPSVDPESDGGALNAHRAFWNMEGAVRKESTITELIYVDNKIPDGIYLLNLQVTSLAIDASPSKPTLFKLNEC